MKNIAILLFISAILFSCKKEPIAGDVTISINHIVGEKDFVLNEENYKSLSGHPYQITKLWYYISDITFIKSDANKVNYLAGFLIKAEDKNSYNIPLPELEPGLYNKISFQFGISKENNNVDFLMNSTDNQNMNWPSNIGPGAFHYMKFEGKYDSLNLGVQKSFLYHHGPTMGNDNSFNVVLDVDEFEIDDNAYHIKINMDIQEWFENPTEYNFSDYGMEMMNQSSQEIYQANGKNVFNFKQLLLDVQ